MKHFEEQLDYILLSKHPEKEFYKQEKENPQFFRYLLKLFPQIEDCANQQQHTKWHIYNVLDHTLHSIKHINSLSHNLPAQQQRVLAYTMFYHDLGKPEALALNLKTNSKYSFTGHQDFSADIVEKTIDNFSFNKQEQTKIYTLVKNHDFFMLNYKNPLQFEEDPNKLVDSVQSDMILFGQNGFNDNILKDLILVAKADNLAQNPEFTAPCLYFIDKYEHVFDNIMQDTEPQQ